MAAAPHSVGSTLLVHSVISLGVAGVGLYLAYGPLASVDWFINYGAILDVSSHRFVDNGGWLEFYRFAVLLTIFLILSSWTYRHVTHRVWSSDGGRSHFFVQLFRDPAFRPWFITFSLALTVAVIVYNWLIGPFLLSEDITDYLEQHDIAGDRPVTFEHHVAPYLAYSLYSVGSYVLLALPCLALFVVAMDVDRRNMRVLGGRLAELSKSGRVQDATEVAVYAATFDRLKREFTGICFRVGIVTSLILTYLIFETYSNFIFTLQCWAQESMKWACWVMFLAYVPIAVFLGRRYHAHWLRAQQIAEASETWALGKSDLPLAESAKGFRMQLRESMGPAKLVVAWQSAGGFYAGATLILLASLAKQTVADESLVSVSDKLVPTPFCNVFQRAYVQLVPAEIETSQSSVYDQRHLFEPPCMGLEAARIPGPDVHWRGNSIQSYLSPTTTAFAPDHCATAAVSADAVCRVASARTLARGPRTGVGSRPAGRATACADPRLPAREPSGG
jgi:hypothetical protein